MDVVLIHTHPLPCGAQPDRSRFDSCNSGQDFIFIFMLLSAMFAHAIVKIIHDDLFVLKGLVQSRDASHSC
jgi:hypothetical protein